MTCALETICETEILTETWSDIVHTVKVLPRAPTCPGGNKMTPLVVALDLSWSAAQRAKYGHNRYTVGGL